MYSVVLMMALSGSAETPALFGRNKGGDCHGCNGCTGGCSGVVYASCNGCEGGSCNGGGRQGLLSRLRSRMGGGGHNCHGSCSGSCHGCEGGGCHGVVYTSCHGGYGGCYGSSYSCHGGSSYSCHGGYSVGCYGGAYYGGACYGGGCSGGVIYGEEHHGGVVVPPPPPGPKPMPAQEDKGKGKKGESSDEALIPTPATIVVSLPAEAKLLVDGQATTSKSSVRTFASPALEPGKEYQYSLKAELVRGGKTLTASKEVTVRAGDNLRVALDFPAVETVAQK